jgi:hypothetical protein
MRCSNSDLSINSEARARPPGSADFVRKLCLTTLVFTHLPAQKDVRRPPGFTDLILIRE